MGLYDPNVNKNEISVLEVKFWGAVLGELARADLGLEREARDEIQTLVEHGVQEVGRLPVPNEDKEDEAEGVYRRFGKKLAKQVGPNQLQKVTKSIVDKVKITLCPCWPICD